MLRVSNTPRSMQLICIVSFFNALNHSKNFHYFIQQWHVMQIQRNCNAAESSVEQSTSTIAFSWLLHSSHKQWDGNFVIKDPILENYFFGIPMRKLITSISYHLPFWASSSNCQLLFFRSSIQWISWYTKIRHGKRLWMEIPSNFCFLGESYGRNRGIWKKQIERTSVQLVFDEREFRFLFCILNEQ